MQRASVKMHGGRSRPRQSRKYWQREIEVLGTDELMWGSRGRIRSARRRRSQDCEPWCSPDRAQYVGFWDAGQLGGYEIYP